MLRNNVKANYEITRSYVRKDNLNNWRARKDYVKDGF